MALCGPHTESYLLDISTDFQLMGIVFRPHGAASFLPVPTGEVFEARVPGDALWGGNSGLLRERLHEARTLGAKFHTLEAVLLEWLEQARAAELPHPAVAYALRELHRVPHARTIESIREEIGLSPRRFIRLFRDSVGMSPKAYGRIQRFQAALPLIDCSETVDWADVAFDCGYYDQSHFIRDFRTFTGFSPSVYAEARRKHLEHIPEEMRQFFTICAHGA
jgi:AraC-like DNA-binding protein